MARIFPKVPQFSKSRELPHPTPPPYNNVFMLHASYIQLAPIYALFPTFSLKINHAFLLWKPTFGCKEAKSPLSVSYQEREKSNGYFLSCYYGYFEDS